MRSASQMPKSTQDKYNEVLGATLSGLINFLRPHGVTPEQFHAALKRDALQPPTHPLRSSDISIRAFIGTQLLKQLPSLLAQATGPLTELQGFRREAYVLAVGCDLNYDDVAQVCSQKVGTVKSNISRARALLKQRFAQRETEPA